MSQGVSSESIRGRQTFLVSAYAAAQDGNDDQCIRNRQIIKIGHSQNLKNDILYVGRESLSDTSYGGWHK